MMFGEEGHGILDTGSEKNGMCEYEHLFRPKSK